MWCAHQQVFSGLKVHPTPFIRHAHAKIQFFFMHIFSHIYPIIIIYYTRYTGTQKGTSTFLITKTVYGYRCAQCTGMVLVYIYIVWCGDGVHTH